MSHWLTFVGRIEPLLWGEKSHTIVQLPHAVELALAAAGARRVDVETDDHPANLAVIRAPATEGAFLRAGQSLVERLGARPGAPLEVRLRPAPAEQVDTSDDISAALLPAGAPSAWEALTQGKRRGLICRIGTAKRRTRRDKRIAALIRDQTGSA